MAQLAERCVWDAEVPGSSPGTPTKVEKFIIPRILLDEPGLCANALIKDPKWGMEPVELEKMAKTILPASHVCVKEHWQFEELIV